MIRYTVENPLLNSPQPQVTVAGGNGPYANTRNALVNVDLSLARGKRVLLKPNVGRVAQPGSGVVTHPQVVAAAIDAFREAGVAVDVGESPIAGVHTLEAFEACGIAEIARERNCPLVDLDAAPAVDWPVPEGRAIDSLRVCSLALEYDLIVSIPVMKMHMHTGVTLAVKNMKGCLWKRSKVALHMLEPVAGMEEEKPLDIAIADLAGVLRPHLSIIDGTVGMEGLGPSAGTPKELDVVTVSTDAFAADAVACRLMGAAAEEVPHLRLGAACGYGVIDLTQVRVTPDDWMQFSQVFTGAPQDLALEFPDIQIHDCQSCSACQSTLLLFLRRYRTQLFDYFTEDEAINIAIGRGHKSLPPGTLCLGNCTRMHRERGIFVPGCPPVGSAILRALGKKAADDELDGRSDPGDPAADNAPSA